MTYSELMEAMQELHITKRPDARAFQVRPFVLGPISAPSRRYLGADLGPISVASRSYPARGLSSLVLLPAALSSRLSACLPFACRPVLHFWGLAGWMGGFPALSVPLAACRLHLAGSPHPHRHRLRWAHHRQPLPQAGQADEHARQRGRRGAAQATQGKPIRKLMSDTGWG